MVEPVSSDNRIRIVSSRQNSQVKELRRLFHEASPNAKGEVAIEGIRLVDEAIRSGLHLDTVFANESASERLRKLLPQLSAQTEVLMLPDEVFASAVPTETTQGLAALVKVKPFSLEQLLAASPTLIVIAAALQDAGNLGTIARSAEAFGANGLLLAERTVSPWNWKAVRASAGSLFRLASVKVELFEAIGQLKARGIRVLATSSHKGVSLTDADLRRPIALIVGNEGAGLSKDVVALADELIAIPHSPRVESLNAAIATSVILYEAARQRRA